MTYSRISQSSQKCPMCGSAVAPGVILCPTCGEDLTKASMVVSTSVRPLSHKLKRKSVGVAKVLYLVLAVIVGATAIVGLGYVPAVSARVPQLASFSTTVEDAVGRAVQWSREVIGQSPAPPQKRPVGKRATAKPQTTPPKPAPVAQKPTPAPQKPAPVVDVPAPAPQKPVAQPGPKPATAKPAVAKPTAAKKPIQPATRPRGSASGEPLLRIGSRAPQFVVKDLRGVIYRLADYRGRRVAVLVVSSLDERGRAAVRAFLNRFSAHPGYLPMIVITNPDRAAIRRLSAAAAGTRVPILLGDEELQAAFRLPRGSDALYVISERGAIAQARLFGNR